MCFDTLVVDLGEPAQLKGLGLAVVMTRCEAVIEERVEVDRGAEVAESGVSSCRGIARSRRGLILSAACLAHRHCVAARLGELVVESTTTTLYLERREQRHEDGAKDGST